MRDSFEVQKNVNRNVKDGVKDIVLWIEHVEIDHQEIIGKETAYQHCSRQLKKTDKRGIRCSIELRLQS